MRSTAPMEAGEPIAVPCPAVIVEGMTTGCPPPGALPLRAVRGVFLALFASQAGVLVMSPILARGRGRLGVSIAGQASCGSSRRRSPPVVALATGRALSRFSPRALIVAGSALLAVGSLASAVAPTFALLALAQVPMWGGIAMLLAAGRGGDRVVERARGPDEVRQPRSCRGTGGVDRRHAGDRARRRRSTGGSRSSHCRCPRRRRRARRRHAAGRRPGRRRRASARASPRHRSCRRWVLGELAANSAWAGTLVYSGALFTETYGTSAAATGVALAIVAAGYLVGNQWAGRRSHVDARQAMLRASIGAAVAVALTWSVTRSLPVTLVLFASPRRSPRRGWWPATVYGFDIAGDLGAGRRRRPGDNDRRSATCRLARSAARDCRRRLGLLSVACTRPCSSRPPCPTCAYASRAASRRPRRHGRRWRLSTPGVRIGGVCGPSTTARRARG